MLGTAYSSRLKKRSVAFGEITMLFERIALEFDYLSSPLPHVFKALCNENCLKNLDFVSLCSDLMEKGVGFPAAWSESIEKSGLPLKKAEKERLCEVSSLLGSSDLSGQQRILSVYINIFTQLSREAKEAEKKYASLSVTGGVFFGCILFVLVI